MGSMVLGGFDVVGDDGGMDGDDMEGSMVLGAGRGRRHNQRVPTPRWMNATTSQGVSRPQEEMDFLPFDQAAFAIAQTTGILIARPQRPFRGERLILNAIFSTGADASANFVIDPAIYVGAVQVGASQGATPIAAFSAQAFGVRLSVPAAGQGTEIKIFLRALTTAVAAIVTGTLIGRAMR